MFRKYNERDLNARYVEQTEHRICEVYERFLLHSLVPTRLGSASEADDVSLNVSSFGLVELRETRVFQFCRVFLIENKK